MLDAVLATLYTFIVLSLLGLGPAALLRVRTGHFSFLLLSPVVGLVITTLLGTYLVEMNVPVVRWARPFALFAVIFSVVLFLSVVRTQILSVIKSFIKAYWFYISLIVVFVLLCAPLLMGGLHFTILRISRKIELMIGELK